MVSVHRSCATACGGLTTTAESTNLYDISVEAEVALGDLLALNAGQNGGAPVPTGTTLVRPCYSNSGPEYLGAPLPPQPLRLPHHSSQRLTACCWPL